MHRLSDRTREVLLMTSLMGVVRLRVPYRNQPGERSAINMGTNGLVLRNQATPYTERFAQTSEQVDRAMLDAQARRQRRAEKRKGKTP